MAEVGDAQEVHDVPRHVAMGEHDPLGSPCGPGCVGQKEEVLETHRHVDGVVRRARQQSLVGQSAIEGPVDGESVPDGRWRSDRSHGVVLDQDRWLSVGEDRGDGIGCQAMVHGREGTAEQSCREEGLEERRVVRAQPRDTVPSDDPELAKTVGETPDPLGQLPVRDGTGAGDQSDVVRRDPGPSLDPGAHPDVTRLDAFHEVRMPNMSKRRLTRWWDSIPAVAGPPW